MARKRMLHPGFFTSEQLAACPRDARLTFAGLWVYADDQGRGKDNAALVKAAVWPLDDEVTRSDVAGHLDALTSQGLVCRYAAGQPLLHVVKWTEHQRISHPTPSKLPPCPMHNDSGEKPESSREDREGSGETLRSAVQFRSGQSSSSTEAAAALDHLDNLKAELDAVGLTARWDRLAPDALLEIDRLVRLHGPSALVKSAQAQHQPNSPAAYASAWLPGWKQLPAPGPRLVREKCSVHRYEDAADCRACAADRKAAS